MLIDFLNSCSCVLSDERPDFEALKAEIAGLEPFIGFMPAIVMDLWPQFVLSRTPARKYLSGKRGQMYFVPLYVHDGWGLKEFGDIVRSFYADEEIECDDDRAYYGAEIAEMILLSTAGAETDTVYVRFEYEDGASFHVFLMNAAPEVCWRNVFEKHGIGCNMLIESHKGFGDWFTNTPFNECMQHPARPELRPGLYFKGKYTSVQADGFREVYEVPESGEHHGVSAVYMTGWN